MNSLEKDELNRLLSFVKEKNILHYLAILVAYTHGLRVSEVTEMRAGQVRDGYLTVRRKKGSEMTTQKLIGPEKELLEKLSASVDSQTRLFPFSPRWFQKLMHHYGKLTGIPAHKCTPHKLKHTTAMVAIDGGMNINELQAYLGHKSLASTGMYLKVDQERATKSFVKAVGL